MQFFGHVQPPLSGFIGKFALIHALLNPLGLGAAGAPLAMSSWVMVGLMLVSGLFALLYGSFRFLVEFVREPDAQLGYLAFGWVTMGQLLSLPMLLAGLVLLALSRLRPVPSGNTGAAA